MAGAWLAGCAAHKAETAPTQNEPPARKSTGRPSATVESATPREESPFGQQPGHHVEELCVGRFPVFGLAPQDINTVSLAASGAHGSDGIIKNTTKRPT